MKQKRKWLYIASLMVLVIPLVLMIGSVGAVYIGDGATQNKTTGGWDLPADKGTCVTGIKSDGTMVTKTSVTSRPDCLATTFSTLTTQAACIGNGDAAAVTTSDLSGGSHYWATTCVANDGTAISLKGLDRTATMCNQAAIAAGKAFGTWASACTSAWVYMGSAGDGKPGFCYTTLNVSDTYATKAACPTSTTGYTWTDSVCVDTAITTEDTCINRTYKGAAAAGTWYADVSKCVISGTSSSACTTNGGTYTTWSRCTFSYGITGKANAPIYKKNHVATAKSVYKNAGDAVDLSALTQGQCLYNGASWSTGTTKSGTATVGTSTIATVTGSRAPCLECHNSTSQYNTYEERWKDTYLKTGHKNMLRKVTKGYNWAGPNGVVYTTDGTGTISFTDGTYTSGSTTGQLYYVYGDWMASLPSVVYGKTTVGTIGDTNGYSCAACHTTGWANVATSGTQAGLCSDSSKKTKATCASPAVWVDSKGIQGVNGAEPAASFSGIKGITGTWDLDGIQCSRCHASTFPAVTGTSTHNSTPAGSAITNLCFSCHQSPATTYSGPTDSTGVKNLDPTAIPTGAGHGANWGREFNGHVLGNSFLNSPHGQFTGTITPNKLGKYDIATGGTYASAFVGYICRTSSTSGSGSILATNADGTKIATSDQCTAVGGYWVREGTSTDQQGNCTTCHDVHQSIVPAVKAEEPLRRECVTCHTDKEEKILHASGPGTPLASSDSCVVCHMPKSTSEGFPMHLWRINTDPNYDTFPTQAEFQGGLCSNNEFSGGYAKWNNQTDCEDAYKGAGVWTAAATKTRAAKTAPDGTYTNAVWVDLDNACGQCHGGSAGAGATANGAKYLTKAELAIPAAKMHGGAASVNYIVANFAAKQDSKDKNTYAFDASSTTCPSGATCTYSWDFGDSATASGTETTTSHTYTTTGKMTVKLTVSATGYSSATASHDVVLGTNSKPVADLVVSATDRDTSKSGLQVYVGDTVTVTDTSVDATGDLSEVTINWGDGKSESVTIGGSTTHSYSKTGKMTITVTAVDSAGFRSSKTSALMVLKVTGSISGTITAGDLATSAKVVLKTPSGKTVRATTSSAKGVYSFKNVPSGNYTVTASKKKICSGSATVSISKSVVQLTDINISIGGAACK